jgi:hypothetical protein
MRMAAVLDPRLTLLTVGLLVLSGLGAACTAEPSLSVELVTDLMAGQDFDAIYLERARAPLDVPPRCSGTDHFDHHASYRLGAPVGAAERVHSGETWVVRVTLCKGDDVVIYRAAKDTILANTQLRVVMARSCFESECDSESCDYTTCEPSIECHWGNLHACERPACGTPEAPYCPAGQDCVGADCLEALASAAGHAGARDGGASGGMDARASSAPEGGELDATPPEAVEEAAVPDAANEAAVEASPTPGDAQPDAEGGPARGADAQPDGDVVVPTAAPPFSPTNKARALYVGDALASETQGKLQWWLGRRNSVDLHGVVGGQVAICDFLESGTEARPLAAELARDIKEKKPHLIVLQFWGDAPTPCMADVPKNQQAQLDRYKADAEELVRQIERSASAAGIPRPKLLWVLQGPEPDPAQRDRPRLLNQIYRELAARSMDGISDAGKWVSMEVYPGDNRPKDRYEWSHYLPCLDAEKAARDAGTSLDCVDGPYGSLVKLHRDGPDAAHSFAGKVLFCLETTDANFKCTSASDGAKEGAMPGANRYGLAIAGDINLLLGITTL